MITRARSLLTDAGALRDVLGSRSGVLLDEGEDGVRLRFDFCLGPLRAPWLGASMRRPSGPSRARRPGPRVAPGEGAEDLLPRG